MRISYSRRALAQLDEIFTYINKDNQPLARPSWIELTPL